MSRMFALDSSAAPAPTATSTLPDATILRARFAPWRSGLAWILALLLAGHVSVAQAAPRKAAAKSHSRSRAKAHASTEARAREEAEAVAGSKIALFAFRGDNTEQIRAQVIKVLKTKVREISTNLKSPDTTEQFRDMGAALDLALYVHGQVKDKGKDMAVLTIDLRSGVSGRKLKTVKLTGNRRKLYADAEDELWQKIEKPFGRACLEATKAVRHHNAPMRIEAGTPIEDSSARSSL
ncbi:MAG TPA: hypothetical protein VF524_10970 [Polyangia bacterium]